MIIELADCTGKGTACLPPCGQHRAAPKVTSKDTHQVDGIVMQLSATLNNP